MEKPSQATSELKNPPTVSGVDAKHIHRKISLKVCKALVFAAAGQRFGNMDDECQYTRSPAWEELVSTSSLISSPELG